MCVKVKVEDKLNVNYDISDNLVYNAPHSYLCSNCNYELSFNFGCIRQSCIDEHNYCPKCGAKLDWDGIKTREDYVRYLCERDGGVGVEYFEL